MKKLFKTVIKPFKFNKSLSIVIPAYREEENLPSVVKDTVTYARKISKNFEIIIVNDGSPDKTGEIAESLAKTYREIRVIHHKKNLGLGRTAYDGIKASKKDIILYLEGDGQQLLIDQIALLKKISEADIVLGTRGKRTDYNFFRNALSVGYLVLLKLTFNFNCQDINWTHVYRREIFDKIELKSITPFLFTEIAIKAKRLGFKIAEAPSVYRPRGKGFTSLGNVKTAYKMFREMFMLRFGLLK